VMMIRVTAYDGWMPDSLAECIALLQRVMTEIPEEYRASAEVNFFENGHETWVSYEKPETQADKVKAARENLQAAERRLQEATRNVEGRRAELGRVL
jgi:hypothetical protein